MLDDAIRQTGHDGFGGHSAVYVCPKGFDGKYKLMVRRVWGNITAGKVNVRSLPITFQGRPWSPGSSVRVGSIVGRSRSGSCGPCRVVAYARSSKRARRLSREAEIAGLQAGNFDADQRNHVRRIIRNQRRLPRPASCRSARRRSLRTGS